MDPPVRMRAPVRWITRVLEWHPADGGPPQPVTITIGPPEPFGENCRMRVTLEGAGKREEHRVAGVDGIQCAVGALFLLPTYLSSFPGPGRHTFLGSDDLGFVHHDRDEPDG